MSNLIGDSGYIYRNPPISNVTVNNNIVAFINASGKHKVKLTSALERVQFIKWLLS